MHKQKKSIYFAILFLNFFLNFVLNFVLNYHNQFNQFKMSSLLKLKETEFINTRSKIRVHYERNQLSQRQIAKNVGCAQSTVSYWFGKWSNGEDRIVKKKSPGRPLKLNDNEIEKLRQETSNDPFATRNQLIGRCNLNQKISRWSISNYHKRDKIGILLYYNSTII